MKCTVVENFRGVREERPLHLIQFTTDTYFEYEPGDLIDVTIESHPLRNRQFSIAGDYPDGVMDLVIRDAGVVGHHLCTLQEGDTFEAEYIGGMFHPQWSAVWISSGSGLAPFRAVTLKGRAIDTDYFCNIDAEDEIHEIVAVQDTVNVMYSYDHKSQKAAIKERIDTMRDRQIFVCGSSRYVTEMCSFLGDLGIDPLYIETDMYGAATD